MHNAILFSFFLLSPFQVKIAYINFLNHCYVDTEVEMKEIYTSNHMWKLFENFLVDICRVRSIVRLYTITEVWDMSELVLEQLFGCVQVCNNTSDRKHADTILERYVTETVMSIVTTFFSSPFSDQSTSLQVNMASHSRATDPHGPFHSLPDIAKLRAGEAHGFCGIIWCH